MQDLQSSIIHAFESNLIGLLNRLRDVEEMCVFSSTSICSSEGL